jgi:hypothetical protein
MALVIPLVIQIHGNQIKIGILAPKQPAPVGANGAPGQPAAAPRVGWKIPIPSLN